MREAFVMSNEMFGQLQAKCMSLVEVTPDAFGIPIHVYHTEEQRAQICDRLWRAGVRINLCVEEQDELEGRDEADD